MQVFSPFRVVGNICSDIPISYTTLYEQPILMVATGCTFQLYRGNELSMLRGGPVFVNKVSAVSHSGKYRIVAEGPYIHAFSHHKAIWTNTHSPILKSPVTHVLVRDDVVFSVGEDKIVVACCIKTGKRLIDFPVQDNETPLCIVIAEGYANKIIIGTTEGSIQLYNFKKGTFLFSSSHKRSPTQNSINYQIQSIACSKYRDIIAYGTSDGRVVVYNYGTDELITTFFHKGASVSSVCFRSDKDDLVVSGTSTGEVAIWDISNRCLSGMITRTKEVRSKEDVIDRPHTDAVHSLVCFPGTQMLVTGGSDNALIQFRFDTVDGCGLLVRERRGHMGSCSAAHFFNSDLLVTAGLDQALRVTHLFSDRASWELSQGKVGRRQRETNLSREVLKLPHAIALASSTNRNYQWPSLVSIHDCSATMCGWRMDTRALACKASGITAGVHSSRCVTVSQCGNFALIGYTSGNLVSINLQNKSIRQFHQSSENLFAHNGPVECVQVCKGNTIAVSCGADGKMMLWDLFTTGLLRVITMECPVGCSSSCLHPESSLLVVACTDFAIRVYSCDPDVADGGVLRCFRGHVGAVTSMVITPDSFQHLITASADCAILVWDLAIGACVGAYRTLSPVVSLSFHPDSLFLVSAHAGEKGAFLWTNNLRYGLAPEVIEDVQNIPISSFSLLHFPLAHVEDSEEAAEADNCANLSVSNIIGERVKMKSNIANLHALELDESDSDDVVVSSGEGVELYDDSDDVAKHRREKEKRTKDYLDNLPTGGTMKLSGVPESVWASLPVITQIEKRNQPILPPKKRDVPFFLPTVQDLRPTFIVQIEKNKKGESTEVENKDQNLGLVSLWQRTLFDHVNESDTEVNFDNSLMLLVEKNIGAAAIDLEIRRIIDIDEDLLNKTIHERRERGKELQIRGLEKAFGLKNGEEHIEKKYKTDFLLDEGMDGYSIEETDTSIKRLSLFLNFVAYHLEKKQAIDLIQGMLAAFLGVYGPIITILSDPKNLEFLLKSRNISVSSVGDNKSTSSNPLMDALVSVMTAQEILRQELDHMSGLPVCLVSTFSNAFA